MPIPAEGQPIDSAQGLQKQGPSLNISSVTLGADGALDFSKKTHIGAPAPVITDVLADVLATPNGDQPDAEADKEDAASTNGRTNGRAHGAEIAGIVIAGGAVTAAVALALESNSDEAEADGPPPTPTKNTGSNPTVVHPPTSTPVPPATPTMNPTVVHPPTATPTQFIPTATPTPFIPTATPTPFIPTPTQFVPTPESIRIQAITKKALDVNENGVFDSQDLPLEQEYQVWIDVNRNNQYDSGEPVQTGRTHITGPIAVEIKYFDGNWVGANVCAREFNVSPNLQIVIEQECNTVDSSRTVENHLLNKNKRSTPVPFTPSATSTGTPKPTETVQVIVPTPPAPRTGDSEYVSHSESGADGAYMALLMVLAAGGVITTAAARNKERLAKAYNRIFKK